MPAISRFPDAPPQIAALKVEARGYPVPYFVSWVSGLPEFRAVDPRKITQAHNRGLCWVCGEPIAGQVKAFVIGPMCAINRIAPEPPSHPECARFTVVACPFLSRPMAKRRPMKEGGGKAPAGLMIERNPGVTLIWFCRAYRTLKEPGGLLFRLGTPHRVEWYAEGRTATRDEVMASVESGFPILQAQAREDGPEAVQMLDVMRARADKLWPA